MNTTAFALTTYNSSHQAVHTSSACEFTTFEFKCFRATVYTYMLAISLTDAIALLVNLPTGLGRCAGHLESCTHPTFKRFRFHISYFTAYIRFGVANTAEAASAWLTVLISVERYMAMKFPMLALTYCRQGSGKMHVFIIILIAVAFNFPLFFILRISPKNVTSEKGGTRTVLGSQLTAFGESTDYDVYTWFRFVLVQIIPLIALCIFSTLLINVVSESYRKPRRNEVAGAVTGHKKTQELMEITSARKTGNCLKHQRGTKPNQLDRRQRAQTKLTIMQICVIFLFLIGQIPQAFSFEKISNAIMPPWCGRCCKLKIYYRMCSMILSQISYSLSFFIYLSLNRYFRKTLLTCCRNKPVEQYTRASRVA
ncbi:hypothetical protein ECG_03000 [Echinococcus granulosus]|uniref:G protein coupled receptor n=1 Tax=Echinococcus granulosus TaxID=6210 RepID=A0A068WIW1_ECHGR|nr:hypothetical protein ECG_03000 [Echinococcus granulosus]CDS20029.1 G protein coupled receptor fragment [Echinococcus granulosus]